MASMSPPCHHWRTRRQLKKSFNVRQPGTHIHPRPSAFISEGPGLSTRMALPPVPRNGTEHASTSLHDVSLVLREGGARQNGVAPAR